MIIVAAENINDSLKIQAICFCKITRIRRKTVLSDCKQRSVLEINFSDVPIDAFLFKIGSGGNIIQKKRISFLLMCLCTIIHP